ncbi:MAG: DUF523 domain-containing protein [Candidatus Omnitrophica bacterium]|nr:DUF523 domain-containing protein [Candidatus Omnitrophota bacterium]
MAGKIKNSKEKKYIVSACLIGKACFYDGSSRCIPEIKDLFDRGLAIALCPEELSGFKAPRPAIEIFAGTGEDVLKGKAYVFNKEGKDVSINVIKGSKEFLNIAQENEIKKAILKARSPCCGRGSIYDGTFSGKLKKGNGVTAALLLRHNIDVVTDEEFLRGGKNGKKKKDKRQ